MQGISLLIEIFLISFIWKPTVKKPMHYLSKVKS